MPDNKHITEPRDRIEVNIHEDYERKRWAREFNITEDRLREVVRQVGPMVGNIKRKLGLS